MNCPACHHELKLLQVTGVKTHACEGSCGGLWFEWHEIKKMKDRNPAAGAELLHVERADGVYVFRDIQHPCPHCIHTLLYRHCFSRAFNYEVDQCAKCAGFWIDTGVLSNLSKESSTQTAIDTASLYFKNLFEENLKPENLTHPDTQEAAQIIFNLFRFLTPAEYLRLLPRERIG